MHEGILHNMYLSKVLSVISQQSHKVESCSRGSASCPENCGTIHRASQCISVEIRGYFTVMLMKATVQRTRVYKRLFLASNFLKVFLSSCPENCGVTHLASQCISVQIKHKLISLNCVIDSYATHKVLSVREELNFFKA